MPDKKTPVDEKVLMEMQKKINQQLKASEPSEQERKFAETDRTGAYDNIEDYNQAVRNSIRSQIEFKDRWRKRTLVSLLILTLLLFINLFVLIYLPGITIPIIGYTLPQVDNTIMLTLISATFLNTFALLTLIFKFIFSPTDNLMQHDKEMYK